LQSVRTTLNKYFRISRATYLFISLQLLADPPAIKLED